MDEIPNSLFFVALALARGRSFSLPPHSLSPPAKLSAMYNASADGNYRLNNERYSYLSIYRANSFNEYNSFSLATKCPKVLFKQKKL